MNKFIILSSLLLVLSLIYLVWNLPADSIFVLYKLRIPRLLLLIALGATLSVIGLVMQTVFHNPLASPYTLGIGGAAAFGATVNIIFDLPFFNGVVFAFLAAFLVILLMVYLSNRYPINSILLLGVILSFFFSSLVVFMQYLGDYADVFTITRWLMGSVNLIEPLNIVLLIIFSTPGIYYLYKKNQELDLLLLGSDLAQTKGLDLKQFRNKLLFLVSILTAIVVAFCGPIAFVGIMVPNTVRLIFGSLHKQLILACILSGALLLVFSDLIAKNIIYPYEIPIGIITALFGAPWFLFFVLSHRKH